MRPGYHSIVPYLIVSGGAQAFLQFAKKVFGAQERVIVPGEDGRVVHGEMSIGDSVVEFADATAEFPPRPAALHVYTATADDAYQRALDAGAESLYAPVDQDYGDREACVRDNCGNIWYIARHQATGHKPEMLRDVTPYLHVSGAARLIEFLERAFAATTLERLDDPDRIAHAKVRIGDSVVELSDAHGQWKPLPVGIQLYVDSVDEVYRKALEAGAVSEFQPAVKPYGDRMAGVRDFAGNQWFLSEYVGNQVIDTAAGNR